MGKKASTAAVNLDSFIDILTCLIGILFLIIILTSIDASQVKILVPTPMAHETDKKSVFVECRNNQVFPLDLGAINQQVQKELDRIDQETQGKPDEMIRQLKAMHLETEYYDIDLSYVLMNQLAVKPKPDVPGLDLSKLNFASTNLYRDAGWLGELLNTIKPSEEMVTFLVRDDSFDAFKRARALAWNKRVEAAYQLLDLADPLKFGLGGTRVLAQ
jgi:biopolymer transport protein ExbD